MAFVRQKDNLEELMTEEPTDEYILPIYRDSKYGNQGEFSSGVLTQRFQCLR